MNRHNRKIQTYRSSLDTPDLSNKKHSNSRQGRAIPKRKIPNTNNYVFKRLLAILGFTSSNAVERLVVLLREQGVEVTKSKINRWTIIDVNNRVYTPLSDDALKVLFDAILRIAEQNKIVTYADGVV